MSTREKFLAAFLLFIAWGVLVYYGKAPAADLVTAIRDALIAIGVFHATLSTPGGQA